MIDFQSIPTTTDPSSPAQRALVLPVRPVMPTTRVTRMTRMTLKTVAFVDRDSIARCDLSRGWTLPASEKSSHNAAEGQHRLGGATSEGDSNTLGDFNVQDTEIEVTGATSA